MDVFPEPVRPAIPIFSPALMVKLNLDTTSGKSYLYLILTSLKQIFPELI